MTKKNSKINQHHHYKRWSRNEDLRLIRQVQAFPQNLHKCFITVAEELGRTENGVANRWYNVVSHDPLNGYAQQTSKPKSNYSFWTKIFNIFS